MRLKLIAFLTLTVLTFSLSGCKKEAKKEEIIIFADHSGSVTNIPDYLENAGKKIEEYLGYCDPETPVKVYHFAVNARLYKTIQTREFKKELIEPQESALKKEEKKYTLLKNIDDVIEDEIKRYKIKTVIIVSDAASQPPKPVEDLSLDKIIGKNQSISFIWIKPDMEIVLFKQGERIENPEISVIAKILRGKERNYLFTSLKIILILILIVIAIVFIILILRLLAKFIVPIVKLIRGEAKKTSETFKRTMDELKSISKDYKFWINIGNQKKGIEKNIAIVSNEEIRPRDKNIHYEIINIKNFYGSLYVKIMKEKDIFKIENHSSEPVIVQIGNRQIDIERGKKYPVNLSQQITSFNVFLKLKDASGLIKPEFIFTLMKK